MSQLSAHSYWDLPCVLITGTEDLTWQPVCLLLCPLPSRAIECKVCNTGKHSLLYATLIMFQTHYEVVATVWPRKRVSAVLLNRSQVACHCNGITGCFPEPATWASWAGALGGWQHWPSQHGPPLQEAWDSENYLWILCPQSLFKLPSLPVLQLLPIGYISNVQLRICIIKYKFAKLN